MGFGSIGFGGVCVKKTKKVKQPKVRKPLPKGWFGKLLLDYGVITISGLLYAFTFNFFFETNDLAMGGFSGIGQVLHHFFPILTPGLVVFVMNIPLIIIGIKKQGWSLLFTTIYAIAVTSFFMDGMNTVVAMLGWHYPATEPMLASVFGGILCGASLGLMMLKNATTGGTELAARLLKYVFRNLSIGRLCLVIDVTVVSIYAITHGILESALYGIIAMYIASIAMDMVVYGANNAKVAYIVSDRYEEISAKLMELGLGATILEGRGAFTGSDKRVLMCAAKSSKIARVKSVVVEIDPDKSFIIVTDAKEVYGEGFGEYNEDTL